MPEARPPTIVVTRSSGLIGSRLVHALAGDATVVGLDVRSPERRATEPADFIHCDLTDDGSTRRAWARVAARHGRRITSLVHLGVSSGSAADPDPLTATPNADEVRRLLDALDGFDLEQLVFESSLLAMKPADTLADRIDEASVLRDALEAEPSELEAERLAREESGAPRVVVLRRARVYDDDCHSPPIGHQIGRIYRRSLESMIFPGDTRFGQPFLHADDLASCLRHVIVHRSELDSYEVFLVAEPDVMSYEELQDQLGHLIHGEAWPTMRIPRAIAQAGAWIEDKIPWAGGESEALWLINLADQRYPVEVARARQRLGWEPQRRLRDTLPRIVGRIKQDPQRWFRRNRLPFPEEARAPLEGGS